MRGGLKVALCLAALVLVACEGSIPGATTSPPATTPPSSAPTSTLPPVVDCPGVGEFVEGGGVAEIDGEGTDSTRLGRISWTTSDQCESFDFEFETSEGAPATTVPGVEIEYLESLQVIRVSMDVGSASLVEQLVETEFVERLYVVRSLDGAMFVDLHLAAPAAARARVTSEPARLTVDLRPGFLEFGGSSTIGGLVVSVSPTTDSEVETQTVFSGYARTFESNVVLTVMQDGVVLLETFTTAADSVSTWGEFELEASLPPGDVEIVIGEPVDEGQILPGSVTINLTVR